MSDRHSRRIDREVERQQREEKNRKRQEEHDPGGWDAWISRVKKKKRNAPRPNKRML